MRSEDWRERAAALAVLLVGAATIAGALASEHLGGLLPCKLCLWQRWPYYVGVPLALMTLLSPWRWRPILFAALALVFLASAGLGAYHAGVEWGFFRGPSDCGGGSSSAPGSVDALMSALGTVRVVSCTEAAWRLAGLSLAGWNAIVSLALAGIATGTAWVGMQARENAHG